MNKVGTLPHDKESNLVFGPSNLKSLTELQRVCTQMDKLSDHLAKKPRLSYNSYIHSKNASPKTNHFFSKGPHRRFRLWWSRTEKTPTASRRSLETIPLNQLQQTLALPECLEAMCPPIIATSNWPPPLYFFAIGNSCSQAAWSCARSRDYG